MPIHRQNDPRDRATTRKESYIDLNPECLEPKLQMERSSRWKEAPDGKKLQMERSSRRKEAPDGKKLQMERSSRWKKVLQPPTQRRAAEHTPPLSHH